MKVSRGMIHMSLLLMMNLKVDDFCIFSVGF